MWPPSRSDACMASSRLTRPPVSTAPSAVASSVWFIASVSKPSASTPVAVKQAPSTATESPRSISDAKDVAIRNRAPSSPLSTASTLPTSWISPVNTSPLLVAGGHQHILADSLGGRRQGDPARGSCRGERGGGGGGGGLAPPPPPATP